MSYFDRLHIKDIADQALPVASQAHLKMPILTLIPETWNLLAEAIEHACKQKDLPVLMVTGEGEEYHGASWDIPVLIEESGKPGRSVLLRVITAWPNSRE